MKKRKCLGIVGGFIGAEELRQLRKERDRYRKALEKIASRELYDGIEEQLANCIEEAQYALKEEPRG